MGHSATAIDVPRFSPTLRPHRRHRVLTGTSGILLALGFFAPSMDIPRVWVPHVYGLVFALFALAQGARAVGVGAAILRGLGWMVAVAGAAMLAASSPVGAVELVLGVFLIGAMGRGAEPRMASTAVLMGAVSAAWFALWSATPDAVTATYIGLASSLGLFVGGLWWLVEVAWQPDAHLPTAIVRS